LKRSSLRALYLSVAVVVLDQVSKLLVKGFSLPILNISHAGMEIGSTVPLLGNALRLTYIENAGMAFGLEIGSQFFLAIFSLAASVGVFYYLHKVRDQSVLVRASLAMILGGAIGNLIDRVFYGVLFGEAPLFYGKVVDFIDVNFLHLSRFGIFNVADAAVSTGVILLLVFHRALDQAEEPSPGSAELQRVSKPENGDTP
jgi:signal peptidase II